MDRGVLVDQPQVDLVFQLQKLIALGREHPGDRNAGPLADDLGDLLGIDLFLEQPMRLLGLSRRRAASASAIRFSRSFARASSAARRLELLLLGPLAALLHVADLVPGSAVLDFYRVEPLADFLDVAQAGLLHLPLAAQVLKLLLDLADLVLDLGQPLEGVLFLLVPSIRSAN